MVKQTTYDEVPDSDWVTRLGGIDAQDAITWLAVSMPACAVLDYHTDYDGDIHSYATISRLETDEEEAARELKEAEEEAQRQRKVDIELARRKATEDSLLKSKIANDVALHAYLQKYKDHPQVNDLENLFRARMQLEFDGHPKDGVAMKAIVECMEVIENG